MTNIYRHNNGAPDPNENFDTKGRGVGHRPTPSKPGSAEKKPIYWPIIGEITAVYHVDSKENRSAGSNSSIATELSTKVSGEHIKNVLAVTSEIGHHIECDVEAIDGIEPGTTFNRVPLCISFGGIHNYSAIIPSARKNTTDSGAHGDGDLCVLHCIGGDQYKAIITGFVPHHLNTVDGTRTMNGQIAGFSFNGLEALIDSKGSFLLDGSKSGTFRELDPNNGTLVSDSSNADGSSGSLSFITKGDINIGSGFSDISSEEQLLPKGNMLIRSAKDMSISSQYGSIKIDTPYTKGPIILQGMHGGAKNAARKGDRVKIVAGADGDLFSYLSQQRFMLREAGIVCQVGSGVLLGEIVAGIAAAPSAAISGTPGGDTASIIALSASTCALAGTVAGVLSVLQVVIESFNLMKTPPTFASGYITEGSSLVKIGCDKYDIKNSEVGLVEDKTLDFLEDLTGLPVKGGLLTACIGTAVTQMNLDSIGDPISTAAANAAQVMAEISTKAQKIITITTELPEVIANKVAAKDTVESLKEDIHEEKFTSKYPDESSPILDQNQDKQKIAKLEAEKSQAEQDEINSQEKEEELEAAIESVEQDIEEAKVVAKTIMGSPEAQMAIDLAQAADIALDNSLTLFEKIEQIGSLFGAEKFFAYIDSCYHIAILGVIAAIEPIFASIENVKDLDAKIRELGPSLPEKEVKMLVQILGAI